MRGWSVAVMLGLASCGGITSRNPIAEEDEAPLPMPETAPPEQPPRPPSDPVERLIWTVEQARAAATKCAKSRTYPAYPGMVVAPFDLQLYPFDPFGETTPEQIRSCIRAQSDQAAVNAWADCFLPDFTRVESCFQECPGANGEGFTTSLETCWHNYYTATCDYDLTKAVKECLR